MRESLAHCLHIATHPALLGLGTAAPILLWMPFGVGYYGWPWEAPAARWGLAVAVLLFPLYAAAGCVAAVRPKPSAFRLVVAVCALAAGVFGCLAMLHWLKHH